MNIEPNCEVKINEKFEDCAQSIYMETHSILIIRMDLSRD